MSMGGLIIDLTKRAFERIGLLTMGLIEVEIEEL